MSRLQQTGIRTTPISSAERDAYLSAPAVSPPAASLTMTHIMTQKYLAQWGWAHGEIWMDLRRFHYTDIDPASTIPVFPGFLPPVNLFVDNAGKVVQRVRPRFNSEYVWNRPGLDAIGGLAADYQTKPLWITLP